MMTTATAKKITKATFKSFVKKNANALFIKNKSHFDGMQDCVVSTKNSAFVKATTTDTFNDATLGISGIWLVGSSRDHFSAYSDDDGYQGFEVYNCVGCFVVATLTNYVPEPTIESVIESVIEAEIEPTNQESLIELSITDMFVEGNTDVEIIPYIVEAYGISIKDAVFHINQVKGVDNQFSNMSIIDSINDMLVENADDEKMIEWLVDNFDVTQFDAIAYIENVKANQTINVEFDVIEIDAETIVTDDVAEREVEINQRLDDFTTKLETAAVKQSTTLNPPILTFKQPEPQSTPAAVKQPEPQSTPVYIENPIVKTLSRAKRINIRCQFAQENGETPDQVATWCVDNVGLTRGNSNYYIRKYWVGECGFTRLGQGGSTQPTQTSKQVDIDETQPADGDVYFESPTTKSLPRTKRIARRVEFAQRNGETPDQVATWCVDNVNLTRGNSNYYIRKYWIGECNFTRLGQGGDVNQPTQASKQVDNNEQAIVDRVKTLEIDVINRAVNELGLTEDAALKIVGDMFIEMIRSKLSNK